MVFNGLLVNAAKTRVVTYSRKTATLRFFSNIQPVTLRQVTGVRDLGVTSDSSLRFHCHVDGVINSDFRALGVACRVSKEFQNPRKLSMLSTSMCLSLLQYAGPVWNGICQTHSLRIKWVQKRFCPSSGTGSLHLGIRRVKGTGVVLQGSLLNNLQLKTP